MAANCIYKFLIQILKQNYVKTIKNRHFTEAEIAEINSITIRDVVLSTNPTMDEEDIQLNPFHFTNSTLLNKKIYKNQA